MRLFQTATCFHNAAGKKPLLSLVLSPPFVPSQFIAYVIIFFPSTSRDNFQLLAPAFIMTKRDSSLAGITSPRAPMSMPRRHLSHHGQTGNFATSSGSRPQPSSITDTPPWHSFPGTDPSGSLSHPGYTTTAQSVPMPDSHAHQNPVQPSREEAYPLQTEIEQQHRTLHTHIFIEVRSPHQPEVGRLMVTEVDCYGV